MPLSLLVLPSFTLVLSDSFTLRDFQRAHSREIQIPLMRTADLQTAPAQAFVVYKSEYYPIGPRCRVLVWRRARETNHFRGLLLVVLLKIKGFGAKLFRI